jgi:Ca2+-binding RTX toxin-like protein
MFSRRSCLVAVPLLGVLGAVAVAGPASAAPTNPFGCRASVGRLSSLTGAPVVEPYVANPNLTPCATDSAGVNSPSTNLGTVGGFGEASTGPAAAYTDSVNDGTDLGASALASVSGGSTPTGAAGNVSFAGPAQATASYECENGAVQASAGSTLDSAQVGGQTISMPGGVPDTVQLGGGSYVTFNEQTVTATSITEQLVDVHIVGSADVVEGEATVSQPATNACAGITGSGGGGSGTGGSGTGGSGTGSGHGGSTGTTASDVCPVGSTLLATTKMCEIVTSGSGATASGIVVSAPGADEILGGSVISLAEARKLYGPKTACLTGAGPKYVVVGTKKADRITLRKLRLRVLGLAGNDHIIVNGGNRTCVNGGAGNDVIINKQKNRVTVFGANGSDQITLGNGPGYVLGGKGNDRIIAGNGKVNLQGNAGADHIKAGNGSDRLNGGNGNDVIVAGTGSDRLNGGSGNNRLTADGKKAYVQAGKGNSIAHVREPNMKYAKTHGVHTVRALAH